MIASDNIFYICTENNLIILAIIMAIILVYIHTHLYTYT